MITDEGAARDRRRPARLRFLVKAMGKGRWADSLVQRAQRRGGGGLRVFVAGPLGTCAVRWEECAGALLVGGGIGVTPMLAVWDDWYRRVLRDPDAPGVPARCALVFVARDLPLIQAVMPTLMEPCLERGERFALHLHVRGGGGADGGEAGGSRFAALWRAGGGAASALGSLPNVVFREDRPDLPRLLAGLLAGAEAPPPASSRLGVSVCGPAELQDAAYAAARHEERRSGVAVDVHSEEFAW